MKTQSGVELSQIGIGSYGIGGRGHRDMPITEKAESDVYIEAVAYSIDRGSNFTEIALGYGHGESLNLFKAGLDQSSKRREDIFFTHSLYPRDLPTLEIIQKDVRSFHDVMGTDYADSTLVTQSLILKFGEAVIYPLLHELLESGKSRYVSLSNASPDWIRKFKLEFDDKFFAHEGQLSFEVRALQDKGVFEVCNELEIENIIWRPLRRNKTAEENWPILTELADKYQKTQSQIILNWICNQGYRPMVFSTNKAHIDENLTSNDFELTADEYRQLYDFRPPNYDPPSVDWEGASIDDDIVRLVNEFDQHVTH